MTLLATKKRHSQLDWEPRKPTRKLKTSTFQNDITTKQRHSQLDWEPHKPARKLKKTVLSE